jgi:TIR domain/Protein of unknown function (DUF2510)
VRQLFISYSRVNKAVVEQLVHRLPSLGCQGWVDTELRGGQSWWDEILLQISKCDAFIAILSRDSLVSTACDRERNWARALGKPILPIAVEDPFGLGLPSELSRLQMVDYSRQDADSAYALSGALVRLDPTPALPDPLPPAPPPPLSYLNDLVDMMTQPVLTHAQQLEIATQLDSGLRSKDAEEVNNAREILRRFQSRNDLYAKIDRMLVGMQQPVGPEVDGTLIGVSSSFVGTASRSSAGQDRPADPKPGWYADPSGEHEWRWFEKKWTGHVSDHGRESVDPL